jgi:integrase
MIKFEQQKTGTTVSIPLVDPWLIDILEKYNYELPYMPDSKVNKYIKKVCDLAGLDKANNVSSHTARRSGCTNWYMAGMSSEQIMKVSGHKTIAEFKKYIRVTDEEIVEELANHNYFKRLKT